MFSWCPLSAPTFTLFLLYLSQGFDGATPFRAGCSKVSHSLHNIWLLFVPLCFELCQVRIPSHGMVLKSNQELGGYSHSFGPPLHWHILEMGHHCRSKGLWLGCCWCFSFENLQSTFVYETLAHRGVGSLRNQLIFSMFKELCRCCLQQWGLAVSFWKTTYSLVNSLGC